MPENLLTPLFRHHLWANLQLFDWSLTLPEAALAAADPGAFGTVLATLAHLVEAEQNYLWILQGQPPALRPPDLTGLPLTTLRTLVQQSGEQLLALAGQIDREATVTVPGRGQMWQVPKSLVFAQALNHATEHRTNITTILHRAGLAELELSPWLYFLALHDQ